MRMRARGREGEGGGGEMKNVRKLYPYLMKKLDLKNAFDTFIGAMTFHFLIVSNFFPI